MNWYHSALWQQTNSKKYGAVMGGFSDGCVQYTCTVHLYFQKENLEFWARNPCFASSLPVLRIRIRDPVPFWPLDPGSGAILTPGSGIRCLFDPWIRDPGWLKSQDPDRDPGWTTRFIFPRALNPFFWLKYFNSSMRIRDGKNSDPGWEKVGSRDPGSGKTSRIRNTVRNCVSPPPTIL